MKCPCCRQHVEQLKTVLVSLDMNTLAYGDDVVKLTKIECEIAYALAERMPLPLSDDAIIMQVWGLGEPEELDVDSMLKVYIHKLRRKLGCVGISIENIWGRGYRMVALAAVRRVA